MGGWLGVDGWRGWGGGGGGAEGRKGGRAVGGGGGGGVGGGRHFGGFRFDALLRGSVRCGNASARYCEIVLLKRP